MIEEIVGEIRDEHDDPVDMGSPGSMGGPVIVSGEVSIVDFNERFNKRLPLDPSYSTLNGYLLQKTGGSLPPIGTLVFDEELTFRIHAVSNSGIASIEIVPHVAGSED